MYGATIKRHVASFRLEKNKDDLASGNTSAAKFGAGPNAHQARPQKILKFLLLQTSSKALVTILVNFSSKSHVTIPKISYSCDNS
jgi:hypothetical protein